MEDGGIMFIVGIAYLGCEIIQSNELTSIPMSFRNSNWQIQNLSPWFNDSNWFGRFPRIWKITKSGFLHFFQPQPTWTNLSFWVAGHCTIWKLEKMKKKCFPWYLNQFKSNFNNLKCVASEIADSCDYSISPI